MFNSWDLFMPDKNENTTCKKHTGFEERLKNLEANVKSLWRKYDASVYLLIATLIGIVANLIIQLK